MPMSQNSDNKVPTQAAVRGYISNTLAGDVTIGGDLTVQGTTTTIDTQNLIVEDRTLVLVLLQTHQMLLLMVLD